MLPLDKILDYHLKEHREEMSLLAALLGNDKEDLAGMCAISTLELGKIFESYGYNPLYCTTGNHCFLIVDDYIVDATASQFGSGDYLFELPEGYDDEYESFHYGFSSHPSIEEFVNQLDNWPTSQHPISYKEILQSKGSRINQDSMTGV
jgi:hypothetical protein